MTDYQWCFDNPEEAASEICRLTAENEALREEVERLRADNDHQRERRNAARDAAKNGKAERKAIEQERDQLKAVIHRITEAGSKISFGLVEDDAEGSESGFTRCWFGKLHDAIAATPAQSLDAHDAEVIERFISERLDEWPSSLANQLSFEAHEYANKLRQQAKEQNHES